jgi:hypothetical protein
LGRAGAAEIRDAAGPALSSIFPRICGSTGV